MAICGQKKNDKSPANVHEERTPPLLIAAMQSFLSIPRFAVRVLLAPLPHGLNAGDCIPRRGLRIIFAK